MSKNFKSALKYNIPKYQWFKTQYSEVPNILHTLDLQSIKKCKFKQKMNTMTFPYEISLKYLQLTSTIASLKCGAPGSAMNPLLHKIQNHNQSHSPHNYLVKNPLSSLEK